MEPGCDPRIAHVMETIDARIAERWQVKTLAALVDLSASRFAHLFRSSVGMSPLRYLHLRRMERARDLLERTSLTVHEVMQLVGCADPSHFARDFRGQYGANPREYRREHARFGAPRW